MLGHLARASLEVLAARARLTAAARLSGLMGAVAIVGPGSLGLLAAEWSVYHRPALAPTAVDSHPALTRLSQIKSIDALDALASQLQANLQYQANRKANGDDAETLVLYWEQHQIYQRVAYRLKKEKAAQWVYTKAIAAATQANTYQKKRHQIDQNGGSPSLADLAHESKLWQRSLTLLNQIPEDSLLATQAVAKRQTYQAILSAIASEANYVTHGFLPDIAAQTPVPRALHVTLCPVELGDCLDYQGDVPTASPASLIKVPLAIALMDKMMDQGIDLSESVQVRGYNYTETGESSVSVNRAYSLRALMGSMVKHSNNIATNELIDYVGWDYIAQRLSDRGYQATSLRSKLVGEKTYPSHNIGPGPNRITTNDLTQMVRQLYQFQRPEDAALLVALRGQSNPEFGQRAIAELNSPRVTWIGEKWGQNSQVIGTVLVFRVDKTRYVLTVAIDHSANIGALRQVIRSTVQHLLNSGDWQTPVYISGGL
ncbi:MAG: serine hydrolase [Cyanobacteria bacterium P01_D01_bin.128]